MELFLVGEGFMLEGGEGVAGPASELLAANCVVYDIFLRRECATRTTGDCELLLSHKTSHLNKSLFTIKEDMR